MGSIDGGFGSLAGFDGFVRAVSPGLLRSAYLLTGDVGAAEDLLQVTLWRTARRWSAIEGSAEAFAHRVLVNASRDRRRGLRRRAREVPAAGELFAVAVDEVGLLLERDQMIGAVCRLPRRQREVVVLRFYLDLSVSQTAGLLGASQGTVKSYTARALARLRVLLIEGSDRSAAAQSEVANAE